MSIQTIMTPFTISTSYAISETCDNWLPALKSMGYDLMPFGPGIFRVDGIPQFMNLSEAQSFIEDFLDNASESTDYRDIKQIEKIISHACKSAVKAHDKLKSQEVSQLLLDLSKTEKPGSCPHGRPVYVKLRKHEIEKMFKRV
jgi:DNA mismatch repair protein MutL